MANHFENVFLLREMRSLSWRRVSRCLLSTSSNLDQNEFRERVPHVVLSSIGLYRSGRYAAVTTILAPRRESGLVRITISTS